MRYIWGLDLSMNCTGIEIFDENASPILNTSIPTKDKLSHGERLKVIADRLLELKEQYPPDKVIMERGFSRFNTSTQVIYRVHGLVNYLFYECEQIYYPPKTVKEALLNGNATKTQLKNLIKQRYKIEFTKYEVKDKKTKKVKFEECEDESDAFAVGLTYFIKNGLIEWKKINE